MSFKAHLISQSPYFGGRLINGPSNFGSNGCSFVFVIPNTIHRLKAWFYGQTGENKAEHIVLYVAIEHIVLYVAIDA